VPGPTWTVVSGSIDQPPSFGSEAIAANLFHRLTRSAAHSPAYLHTVDQASDRRVKLGSRLQGVGEVDRRVAHVGVARQIEQEVEVLTIDIVDRILDSPVW
jgi:hypothetical protein